MSAVLDLLTDTRAEFYATAADWMPVCTFTRDDDGVWRNGSSACLPTRDFGPALRAYQRAAEWFRAVSKEEP